jgi:hypothetical protein
MTKGTKAMARRMRAGFAIVAVGLLACGAARAQSNSCAEDFQKYSTRRNAQMAALNQLGKANKGKMDPVAACPMFRKLVSLEGEMLSYLTKNKDWCGFPDQLVEQFQKGRATTSGYAAKACQVAGQVKKMQQMQREQAENGGALGAPQQKLPSGPL